MLLATIALAAQIATAPPEIVTGADLVRVCSSRQTYDATYCIAYIAGIHDTVRDLQGIDEITELDYCLPERVSIGAVAQAVSAHIGADESLWTSRAASATILSLMAVYPCA